MNERFRRGLGAGFVIGVLGYMSMGRVDIGKFFKTPKVTPQRKLDMQIVGYSIGIDSTGITLTSPMYKDKEEFDDWVQAYMEKFKPTGLKVTSSIGEKDTPDGPMSTPVLIWRASWIGDESENPPIINVRPLGGFYNN